MAKNSSKGAAEAAAKQAAEKQEAPTGQQKIVLNNNNNPATKGLTQGEKVAYIGAIQTERAFMMTNVENPSQDTIAGLSLLAQATILDVAIGEIASTGSAMGRIIAANENNYKALQAMAFERGVKLPDFKALPAPTEEQLRAAGIVGLLPSEARIVKVEKKNVEEKTIEAKKKENEAIAKAVSNPAEIESEEQLKASLTAMLAKPITEKGAIDRPDARVQRTIKFYRGYLTIQANKAEDKKAELDKIKTMTRQQMLDEISKIVGPCPFALTGTAYFLRKITNETGSPISAFCLYRRGAVPETDGVIEDSYLADVVRILLIWSCNSRIAECEETIASMERQMKKENGAAKVASETAIRVNKTTIEELKDIIAKVTDPSFDIVNNLIDDYNAENEESVYYKLAHRIVNNIMDTYYPDFKGKTLDKDVMLKNVQQRAGIIVNMFRDPLTQSISYSEANLTDMVEVEAPKEDPKPSEEKSKN